MKSPSEKEIIDTFRRRFGRAKCAAEDVESLRIGGSHVVLGIDSLVEGTDVPPGSKLDEVARKSAVACVSDFAAKGVRPMYCIVSVTIPKSYSRRDILKLADGLADAAAEFGFEVTGGDTNEGVELSLSVCMVGRADGIVSRGGAKNNDAIFVTGPFGYTAAGMALIAGKKKARADFKRRALGAVHRPGCRLDFGLAIRSISTSSMDSSDGLSTTLNEMARQSSKKFLIDNAPAGQGVCEFASFNSLDAHKLVFDGGEEYEFAFTAPQRNKTRIMGAAKRTKTPVIEIGRVVSGKGVFGQNGRTIRDAGWRHFD